MESGAYSRMGGDGVTRTGGIGIDIGIGIAIGIEAENMERHPIKRPTWLIDSSIHYILWVRNAGKLDCGRFKNGLRVCSNMMKPKKVHFLPQKGTKKRIPYNPVLQQFIPIQGLI